MVSSIRFQPNTWDVNRSCLAAPQEISSWTFPRKNWPNSRPDIAWTKYTTTIYVLFSHTEGTIYTRTMLARKTQYQNHPLANTKLLSGHLFTNNLWTWLRIWRSYFPFKLHSFECWKVTHFTCHCKQLVIRAGHISILTPCVHSLDFPFQAAVSDGNRYRGIMLCTSCAGKAHSRT